MYTIAWNVFHTPRLTLLRHTAPLTTAPTLPPPPPPTITADTALLPPSLPYDRRRRTSSTTTTPPPTSPSHPNGGSPTTLPRYMNLCNARAFLDCEGNTIRGCVSRNFAYRYLTSVAARVLGTREGRDGSRVREGERRGDERVMRTAIDTYGKFRVSFSAEAPICRRQIPPRAR